MDDDEEMVAEVIDLRMVNGSADTVFDGQVVEESAAPPEALN